MAYVITAPCVADYACVDVCPVKCISPGPADADFDDAEQMFIDPAVCINCGACLDVCPVLAIYEEKCLPDRYRHYAAINRQYFAERGR